jgi:hypothetical protein
MYANQLMESNGSTPISPVQLGWALRAMLLRNHPILLKVAKLALQELRSQTPGVADQVVRFG